MTKQVNPTLHPPVAATTYLAPGLLDLGRRGACNTVHLLLHSPLQLHRAAPLRRFIPLLLYSALIFPLVPMFHPLGGGHNSSPETGGGGGDHRHSPPPPLLSPLPEDDPSAQDPTCAIVPDQLFRHQLPACNMTSTPTPKNKTAIHKWNHHATAKIDQQNPTTTTIATSTLNVPSDIKAALLPLALVPALPLDLVASTVQTVNTLLFNVLLPTTRRQLQQGGLVVYAHAAFVLDHATSPLAKNAPVSEQSPCDLSTDLRCVALSNESMCWTTRVPDGFPTLSEAMTHVALVGIVYWILRSPRVILMLLATCVLFTPLLRAEAAAEPTGSSSSTLAAGGDSTASGSSAPPPSTPTPGNPNCVYTLQMLQLGTEPPLGSCNGPMDRAAAKRRATEQGDCGIGKIPLLKNEGAHGGSTTATATFCGECYPGHNFLEDGDCAFGQFCTDAGQCQDLQLHPFMGDGCSIDMDSHTSLGPCGTGLRCVNGKCAECPAGLVYAPMALVCDPRGRWEKISTEDLGGNGASTSDTSPIRTIPNSAQEATAVFAAFICLGLLVWVVMILVRRCQKNRQNGMHNDDATTSSFTASGSASPLSRFSDSVVVPTSPHLRRKQYDQQRRQEQYGGPNPTSMSPSSSRAAESSVPFGASPPNRSCSTTTGCSQQPHAPSSQAGYTDNRLTTGGGHGGHGRGSFSPQAGRHHHQQKNDQQYHRYEGSGNMLNMGSDSDLFYDGGGVMGSPTTQRPLPPSQSQSQQQQQQQKRSGSSRRRSGSSYQQQQQPNPSGTSGADRHASVMYDLGQSRAQRHLNDALATTATSITKNSGDGSTAATPLRHRTDLNVMGATTGPTTTGTPNTNSDRHHHQHQHHQHQANDALIPGGFQPVGDSPFATVDTASNVRYFGTGVSVNTGTQQRQRHSRGNSPRRQLQGNSGSNSNTNAAAAAHSAHAAGPSTPKNQTIEQQHSETGRKATGPGSPDFPLHDIQE